MSQTMNVVSPDFSLEEPLPLPEAEVHVWRADLEALRGAESRWLGLLSSDESARASRFHSLGDRQRFTAARALLRTILSGYLGSDPKELKFSYSKKEKPSLDAGLGGGVQFNISHSGGVALLAFTRRREVGVDIEQVRCDFDVEAISRRFFSSREQHELDALPPEEKFEAFFRCWTRKEAYIKATGDGLSLPLHQFDVSITEGDGDALRSTRPNQTEAAQWSLQEISAGNGFKAALCARGRDWKLKDWLHTPISRP